MDISKLFKPHRLQGFITFELKDSRDNLITKPIVQPMKSYVLAFIDMLYVQANYGATMPNTPDTSNTTRAFTANVYFFDSKSGIAGTDTSGIVVGTGTNPVALADYKLQTQINHGNGAGQLDYGATTYIAPATSGTTRYFQILRVFTNNTGVTITPTECGIYTIFNTGTYKFCSIRDLIASGSGIAIPSAKALTLTYTIGATV